MQAPADPREYLVQSEIIHSKQVVDEAVARLAAEIKRDLAFSKPLVISVMGGAVVFAGQLLPHLDFPLEFDYVQASRYHNQTQGKELVWQAMPKDNVNGRDILLLDDILDEGHTLKAIKAECLAKGAKRVVIAVLVEKVLGHGKPIKADYIGLQVPNRYVFGCGMDIHGWWRNLPAIYALKEPN